MVQLLKLLLRDPGNGQTRQYSEDGDESLESTSAFSGSAAPLDIDEPQLRENTFAGDLCLQPDISSSTSQPTELDRKWRIAVGSSRRTVTIPATLPESPHHGGCVVAVERLQSLACDVLRGLYMYHTVTGATGAAGL